MDDPNASVEITKIRPRDAEGIVRYMDALKIPRFMVQRPTKEFSVLIDRPFLLVMPDNIRDDKNQRYGKLHYTRRPCIARVSQARGIYLAGESILVSNGGPVDYFSIGNDGKPKWLRRTNSPGSVYIIESPYPGSNIMYEADDSRFPPKDIEVDFGEVVWAEDVAPLYELEADY